MLLLLTLKCEEETAGFRGMKMKQQQPQNSVLIYNQSHFLCNITGMS